MTILQVDTLTFDFDPAVRADTYDKWLHHCLVWNAQPGGKKAVDVLAVEGAPPATAWLIEAKDFRVITNPPKPSNISGLAQQVADKVNDSLAGLADASINATVPKEKQLATDAGGCAGQRIVLHLEPHTGVHTALFPANFAANVLQQLRQRVHTIDANPLVLNIANTQQSGVPWSVS